jgi:site-specific recombinase XerD
VFGARAPARDLSPTSLETLHCIRNRATSNAIGVPFTLRPNLSSLSRENKGDPVAAQELACHKDLRTTQGYLHARARLASGDASEWSTQAT